MPTKFMTTASQGVFVPFNNLLIFLCSPYYPELFPCSFPHLTTPFLPTTPQGFPLGGMGKTLQFSNGKSLWNEVSSPCPALWKNCGEGRVRLRLSFSSPWDFLTLSPDREPVHRLYKFCLSTNVCCKYTERSCFFRITLERIKLEYSPSWTFGRHYIP